MNKRKQEIIIKFDFSTEQTVGEIKKVVGLVEAKYIIPIIDVMDLEANPRASKTGAVTDAILDSINSDPQLFPFKTKGILLASSYFEPLDRGRLKLVPENYDIEGILDGGHNTLAIGLHILENSLESCGQTLPKGGKTWSAFKELWEENREHINTYLESLRLDPENKSLKFYVPVEVLVPRDTSSYACIESFKNDLLEICNARNNNVQLPISDKANQKGYFDTLKSLFDLHNPTISNRVEWKSNDGGDIKVQDIIALSWIPLSLISPVHDENGRIIEPVAPNKIYSGKGSCLKQFEKLMSSSEVSTNTTADYKSELKNIEVSSAFNLAVELPEIFDYIYEMFPTHYNAAGGKYGLITAVKSLNDKHKSHHAPFTGKKIETISPDGFIIPLVFGLQALMEKKEENGHCTIRWSQPPLVFLHANLNKIVKYYIGIFSMCDYDPQKVGKNPQSYAQALAGFKMAIAGIL